MADNGNWLVVDLGQAEVECIHSLPEDIFRFLRNTIFVFGPPMPPDFLQMRE